MIFGKKGKNQREMGKSLIWEELLNFWLHSGTITTLMEEYLPLHDYYQNIVALSQDFIPQKSCHGLGFLPTNTYVKDLSNEVLKTNLDQGATKI